MAEFNKDYGELIIGGISFRAHQSFEESEVMLKSKGCKVNLGVCNAPWKTYDFIGIKDSLTTFNRSVSFNENVLQVVAISVETGDKSWEDFIANIAVTK